MDLATNSGTLLLPGASNVAPGDIIANQYQVEQLLGMGEMGPVVAARRLERERVTLKLIQTRQATNPTFVERFLREGRAAIGIHSEHARRIHEVGRLDGGTPYMVMEHLAGLSLGTFIRSEGPIGCETAVTYVLQVCDALVDAHAQGIVHGDLRPDNVFLIRRNDGSACVKVLGFGIPRMLLPGDAVEDGAMGASPYMSPEQLGSSPDVDARADIWGVGVLLFELLTGRHPFIAHTIRESCRKVLEDNPPPMQDETGQLNAIVQRCLEKQPQRRYPSVQALLIALASTGSAADGAPESDELATWVGQLRHGLRARIFLVAVGIALLVGFAVLLGRLGRVGRGASPTHPGPAPEALAPAAAVPVTPPAVEAAAPPPAVFVPTRDHCPQLRPARRHFSVTNQAKRVFEAELRTRRTEMPDDRK